VLKKGGFKRKRKKISYNYEEEDNDEEADEERVTEIPQYVINNPRRRMVPARHHENPISGDSNYENPISGDSSYSRGDDLVQDDQHYHEPQPEQQIDWFRASEEVPVGHFPDQAFDRSLTNLDSVQEVPTVTGLLLHQTQQTLSKHVESKTGNGQMSPVTGRDIGKEYVNSNIDFGSFFEMCDDDVRSLMGLMTQ